MDVDGNGLCDLSEIAGVETKEPAPEKPVASPSKTAASQTRKSKKVDTTPPDSLAEAAPASSTAVAAPPASPAPGNAVALSPERSTQPLRPALAHPSPGKTQALYHLVEIAGATLLLYFLSWLFFRAGRISLSVHRRIWNGLLLVTFVGSCLLGLFLVFLVRYGAWPSAVLTVVYWHVEIGVALTVIGLIHALWHLAYYKKLFRR